MAITMTQGEKSKWMQSKAFVKIPDLCLTCEHNLTVMLILSSEPTLEEIA